jgi:uncharacterized protein YktB (UPF0637 family)
MNIKSLITNSAIIRNTSIVEIVYLIDEFCKKFEKVKKGHVLVEDTSKKRRNRSMSDSEVITIVILFH